jgi:hypothetical protein
VGPDLRSALHTVSQTWNVPGRSDGRLRRKARASMSGPASPVDVPMLDSGIQLRPLDALRGLAVATRPSYGDDVLGFHSYWALMRYVGAFVGTNHQLFVSPGGERLPGNQRRVMSEDLGIAFSLEIATRWIRRELPPTVPVWVADVDVLRWHGLGGARGRPDYVLAAGDPADPGSVRFGLLECKGTRTPSYVDEQLARGCSQLAPAVAATGWPGLVVSSLFTDRSVEYRALEVQPPRAGAASSALGVRPVQEASWFALARFGGNIEAARRWSPEQLAKRRLDDDDRQVDPVRVARVTSAGREVIGVVHDLVDPAGTFTVLHGVTRQVDDVLLGAAQDVSAAQLAREPDEDAATVRSGLPPVGESYGPDGSALIVDLRPTVRD